jgi:DNA helicase HerA-like ATPase
MGFFIGEHFSNPAKKVFWNYKQEPNPHLMIIGQSGSGKTHLLRKILKHFNKHRIKTFVIDFHGDLHIEEDETFEYTTINPQYGIGLFEFDTNPKSGGIYNRVDELIKIFENSFFSSMSALRVAVLKKLFIDCYKRKGYDPNNPETWKKPLSELPTIDDVLELLKEIKEAANEYNDKKRAVLHSVSLIELNNLLKIAATTPEDKREEFIAKAEDIFENMYLKDLKEIREIDDISSIEKRLGIDDFEFYTKKNTESALDNLEVYLKAIKEANIFTKHNPVPSRDKNIYRFNLKHLNDNLMLFVANLIIQRIFTKLRIAYEYKQNHTNDIKFYIVIDESKLVIPNKEKNNDFHYINRIVSEARKFGLGIILASQRTQHYSEEMLSNIATKIVLRVADNEKPVAKKKLGIKENKVFEILSSKPYGLAFVKTTKENAIVNLA